MFKPLFSAFLLTAMVLAGGCSSGLSGTYRDQGGFLSIRFASAHTAYITTAAGRETRARYEVDGKRVILRNAGGEIVLVRNPDGTLAGSPVGPLRRVNP